MTSVLAGVGSRDSLDDQTLVTDYYSRTHIVVEGGALQVQQDNYSHQIRHQQMLLLGGEITLSKSINFGYQLESRQEDFSFVS